MIGVCNHRAYANLIDLTADSSDDGGSEDTAIPGVPVNLDSTLNAEYVKLFAIRI